MAVMQNSGNSRNSSIPTSPQSRRTHSRASHQWHAYLAEIRAYLQDPNSGVAKIHGLCLAGQVAERLYDHIKCLFRTSQATVSNTTADEKEITALLTAEIWKRYKADTPGQLNAFPGGVDTAATGASVAGENVNIPKDITDNAVSAASAGSGSTESLFNRINHLECWNTALRMIQTAQAQHMIKALNVIADHLGDRNCITVMSAGGPDGFARPIYDLIKIKINDIDEADLKNHRFFIYHDSNNWHPAFKRLTSENPLPSEFVNNLAMTSIMRACSCVKSDRSYLRKMKIAEGALNSTCSSHRGQASDEGAAAFS